MDVAGYRERRSAALKRFSVQIAEEVLASGQEKALEPMSPADRKAVHDAINEMAGGRDPLRGRRPQPPHRHRARRLTPRRCPAPTRGATPPPRCTSILAEARAAGFLGPGPLEPQIRHAQGFAAVARRLAAAGRVPPRLVDLGSGGGLPGLVVAERLARAHLALLEANGRRAAFLRRAVERLGSRAG